MPEQNDLVYDVGMHKGEDSDFYLRKGFRVIGFEADPALAAYCRSRFAEEIQQGRLTVVEGAIVDRAQTGGSVKFYKNERNDVWGTVDGGWAKRNESLGAPSDVIQVPAIDFAECLRRFGTPHYLKIDIEGSDLLCLRVLLEFKRKPDYISLESEKISFTKLKEEFLLLEKLGYRSFKLVQQQTIPGTRVLVRDSEYEFEDGASGVFGSDLPGSWKNRGVVLTHYRFIFLLYGLYGDYGKLNSYRLGSMSRKILERILRRPVPGWYDTHAKLGPYRA